MPAPEQILEGLKATANEWRLLAVIWHIYLMLALAGLLLRKIRSTRVAGVLMTLPLLSVSLLAWSVGNPFNGSVFALAGLVLILISLRLPRTPPVIDRHLLVPSLLMFAFGWIYPHFLEAPDWAYLYAAPTGLIPCPTLSVLVGLALVSGGLGSLAWSGLLALLGLFYGLFGALILGVEIDWALAAGAAILGLTTLWRHQPPGKPNAGS